MPDLREVFEMVKQQTEPDKDSWSEQERRIRQSQRQRKVVAIAVVAALIVAAALLVVTQLDDPGTGSGPAGTNIVSPVVLPGGSDLTLLDLASGDETGTGIVPSGSEVDVSPDGTKITYVGDGDLVYVANTDGWHEHAFSQTGGPVGGAIAPRWSPDGTKIVYQGKGPSNEIGDLFVLDVESGRVAQITHLGPISSGLYYMAPGFAADGRSVLFTMPSHVAPGADGTTTRWNIWSVPAAGGQPTLVERNAGWADAQPQGDLITFSKIDDQGRSSGLYVARSDGSDARKLAAGAINLPRWSPDGSQIGYSDDVRGMYVVDVATGETQQVYPSGEWPEWVDENTMIIDLSD